MNIQSTDRMVIPMTVSQAQLVGALISSASIGKLGELAGEAVALRDELIRVLERATKLRAPPAGAVAPGDRPPIKVVEPDPAAPQA